MRHLLLVSSFTLFTTMAFGQFQATMAYTPGSEARTYTVYSDLHQYRYEFTENGEKGIVIVKPQANQTFILMPAKKFYMKSACDDFNSLMNDPVQASLHFKESQKEKIVGNEKMENYNCVKKEYYMEYHDPDEEVLVYTVWFSKDLNFPVKIINHVRKNNYLLLSDVKNWVPNESYFQVPDDYTEVDERMRLVIPEPPAPKQWTTKTVTLPFEATVQRGTRLKIKIPQDKNYKLSYVNETGKPAKFVRHTFVNGKEKPDRQQGPLKYRTYRPYPGDKGTPTFIWKKDEEIWIEVYEGMIHLKIYQEQ